MKPFGTPAIEGLAHFSLPVAWQAVDFLSDLHLSAATPATAQALLAHVRQTPAQAVFLLGDLFELWVGDDQLGQAFEATFTQELRALRAGRELFFMHGNRDFLLGPEFVLAAGGRLVADPLCLEAFGTRLLVTHGDALCLDDQAYQAFRAQVRQPAWQAEFLARPLHERLAHGRKVRHASEDRKRGSAPETWADVDADAASAWLDAAVCQTLVHGHTHRPATHSLPNGTRRWVLSDWDFDSPGPSRGDVLRWSARGLQRLPVGRPA